MKRAALYFIPPIVPLWVFWDVLFTWFLNDDFASRSVSMKQVFLDFSANAKRFTAATVMERSCEGTHQP